MVTLGGAGRTAVVHLIDHSQWGRLGAGESLLLVSFAGHIVGLDVGGVLYPSDMYPGYREFDLAVTAIACLCWGLALIMIAAYGMFGRRAATNVPLLLSCVVAALVMPSGAAWLVWLFSQSRRWTVIVGALFVPVWVGLTLWQTLRARRRVAPEPVGEQRPLWISWLTGTAVGLLLAVGIVVALGGATTATAVGSVDCSRSITGTAHPSVGICRTSYADLATTLSRPIGTLTPPDTAAPPCSGTWSATRPGIVTANGVARSLGIDKIDVSIRTGVAAVRAYGWIVGNGATAYVVSTDTGLTSGWFVVGMYPSDKSANAAYHAIVTTDVARRLGELGVGSAPRFRIYPIDSEVVFQLDPTPHTRDHQIYIDISIAGLTCQAAPLPTVVSYPVGVRPLSLRGSSCARTPGVGGFAVTPVGLAQAFRKDRVAADAWSPQVGSRWGGLVGSGAEGYVTPPPSNRVPSEGLFVMAVYPSVATAKRIFATSLGNARVARRLRRFHLGATAYHPVVRFDNVILFQLVYTGADYQVVYSDLSDAQENCYVAPYVPS
jgi:hypothetical protein